MEVKDITSSTNFLKKQIDNLKATIAKIKQVSSNVRHRGVEKVNKVARFEVEIKHTNEYIIDLGNEYKAEVTTEQALKILELRLQNYNEKLAKSQSIKPPAPEKNQKIEKVGKENVVKLQDGKSAMLEVIGNENGQDIFNIVEFQPEQTQKQNSNFNPKPDESIKQQKNVQDDNRVKQEDLGIDEQEIQQQTNDIEDDYDEELEDGQEHDFMETIMKKRIQAVEEVEVKPVIKTNLPTIVQEAKEDQKQQKPAVQKVVKQTKQVKKMKKVTLPKEKQAQKEPLPVKISKFKLQKMKERLQKQTE